MPNFSPTILKEATHFTVSLAGRTRPHDPLAMQHEQETRRV